MASITDMRDAITSHPKLSTTGRVTEFLPHLAFLAFAFNEGLNVHVADHGDDKFQATLDGFYALDPAPIDSLIDYLASI